MRIVFNCSVEFARISLNKDIIAGTDLTNQLVGVFARVKEERIAYMLDIEAVFLQVKVSENQRSLSRFLWQEYGGPIMEVKGFEMCVQLFGGKSSPSCSNYTLKRTSAGYQTGFKEDAAKTLLENFYEHGMLNSSPDVQTAVDLISKFRGSFPAGGFNLTKFLRNNVEMVQDIPE